MTFNPIFALLLLPVMLMLLRLGHRFRLTHKHHSESAAIEGAVFAIFGLLLAFTFSGAAARYDDHRKLIVEETNDIGTAYLRLDLLPAATQPALRQLFRDYTNSRLHLYDNVTREVSPLTEHLQRQIWQQSLAAASSPGANPDATKLLLPALNAMIDITATRQNAFYMHPPGIVFLLLFAFSLGCAFLAGYGMIGPWNAFYATALILTVTLTVYATLEIEYPRRGLIRFKETDRTLIDLRNSMD